MPPTTSTPEFAPLPTAERWTLIGAVTAVTASGWGWMLYMEWMMRDMMRGGPSITWMPPPAGAGGWSGYDFWMLFVMWAIMMVAMMTPSAVPMLRMYRVVQRNRSQQTLKVVPWMIFLVGYLASWTAFSAVISVVQWPMHEWGLLDPMMDSRSQLFSGILLIVAGLYQWTPWKDACLTLCRTPMQFLLARWKDGRAGALQMSFEHGLYCIGCCWALMLVLFAVGMMNMLWVAAIALFVIVEKALPSPARLFRTITGLLLASSGFWLLLLHFQGPT